MILLLLLVLIGRFPLWGVAHKPQFVAYIVQRPGYLIEPEKASELL